MKCFIKPKIIITVVCVFTVMLTACENGNDASSGPESTVSRVSEVSFIQSDESSEGGSNIAQQTEKLLLYKVNFVHPIMGYTETYEYNEYGQVLKTVSVTTDGTTASMLYEYNKVGQLVKETREQNGKIKDTKTLTYNEKGLLIKEINSGVLNNNTIIYSYDKNDRITKEIIESSGVKYEKSYLYNEDGSFYISSEEGIIKYNSNGLVLEESFSTSKAIYIYDKEGALLKVENFDEFGELISNEVYAYNDLVTEKVCYSYGERVSAKRNYYDDQGNLIKTASLSNDGSETVNEEREYKLFTVNIRQ